MAYGAVGCDSQKWCEAAPPHVRARAASKFVGPAGRAPERSGDRERRQRLLEADADELDIVRRARAATGVAWIVVVDRDPERALIQRHDRLDRVERKGELFWSADPLQ